MDAHDLPARRRARTGNSPGLLLIKAYHERRGDTARTKILVPDSAHGTNPASAAMAGFAGGEHALSDADGCVDLEALRAGRRRGYRRADADQSQYRGPV